MVTIHLQGEANVPDKNFTVPWPRLQNMHNPL